MLSCFFNVNHLQQNSNLSHPCPKHRISPKWQSNHTVCRWHWSPQFCCLPEQLQTVLTHCIDPVLWFISVFSILIIKWGATCWVCGYLNGLHQNTAWPHLGIWRGTARYCKEIRDEKLRELRARETNPKLAFNLFEHAAHETNPSCQTQCLSPWQSHTAYLNGVQQSKSKRCMRITSHLSVDRQKGVMLKKYPTLDDWCLTMGLQIVQVSVKDLPQVF